MHEISSYTSLVCPFLQNWSYSRGHHRSIRPTTFCGFVQFASQLQNLHGEKIRAIIRDILYTGVCLIGDFYFLPSGWSLLKFRSLVVDLGFVEFFFTLSIFFDCEFIAKSSLSLSLCWGGTYRFWLDRSFFSSIPDRSSFLISLLQSSPVFYKKYKKLLLVFITTSRTKSNHFLK